MTEIYDVVIVGAGTAGLTAAIYSRRAGLKVLMIEEGIYGGQIVNAQSVENYPGIMKISGYQFANNLYEQATGLGAELVTATVTSLIRITAEKIMPPVKQIQFEDGITRSIQFDPIYSDSNRELKEGWEVKTTAGDYKTRTVILATGVKKRKLEIPGEENWLGKGISYCATCDGAFYKDRTVAVIGGGNTALADAEYLAQTCKKVYVIHRSRVFRGDLDTEKRLKAKDNVEMRVNTILTGLEGDERLEALKLRDALTGADWELQVDGLFAAIGQEPANKAFRSVVQLDPQGYIMAAEDCKTNAPGIFAAGDCRTKQVRQLTTAAADGTIAARAARIYINTKKKGR